MSNEKQYKVTFDSARRWALAAYSQTLVDGHYIAARLNDMPGGSIFHRGAKSIGLSVPVGARNRWHCDEPPTDLEAEELLQYYINETGRSEETGESALERIERKLDLIIEMWR